MSLGVYEERDSMRVVLLRTFDEGATWVPVKDPTGTTVTTSATKVTAAGATTIASCPAGKRLRLRWFHAQAPEANTAEVEVTLKVGATTIYQFVLGAPGIFQHGALVLGGTDQALSVSLSGAQTVYTNIDYEVIG